MQYNNSNGNNRIIQLTRAKYKLALVAEFNYL